MSENRGEKKLGPPQQTLRGEAAGPPHRCGELTCYSAAHAAALWVLSPIASCPQTALGPIPVLQTSSVVDFSTRR